VRRMRPRGRGHIVNVSSLAGVLPVPGIATYCATKHGVVAYSEVARLELAGSGVEVSCVMPGIVKTELSSGMEENRYVRSVTPEQVADAIVDALQHPKFDVFVPKEGTVAHRLKGMLPRRAGEAISRATGADHALTDTIGSEARKAYEERAARDIAKPAP